MNTTTQAPLQEPIIVMDKVVKRFGEATVLNQLDFEVAKGEKVTIIGPSGSGKSTVLRILMTLETIDDGLIYVAGKPLWHEYRDDKIVPASQAHLRVMRKEMG
ncbi:MAG: ATP-binding cassette domain-containing protein, partial [Castellaniella sp.]